MIGDMPGWKYAEYSFQKGFTTVEDRLSCDNIFQKLGASLSNARNAEIWKYVPQGVG